LEKNPTQTLAIVYRIQIFFSLPVFHLTTKKEAHLVGTLHNQYNLY